MKKTLLSVALTSVLASTAMVSTSAVAVEGLSANVGLASNYLWRGVSQTDDGAAISGGIDYSDESGVYAGTWASNVDFDDDASYELDFYIGYAADIGDTGFGYDVGYIYYAYPDSAEADNENEYDFGEVYTAISYENFSLTYNRVITSQDGSEALDDSSYVSLDSEFEVAKDLTLGVHVGYYAFDRDRNDNIDDYTDYTDYSVSLSKDGFAFTLSDTDADDNDLKAVVSYSIDIDL